MLMETISQQHDRINRIKQTQRDAMERYKKGLIDWDECCEKHDAGDDRIMEIIGE